MTTVTCKIDPETVDAATVSVIYGTGSEGEVVGSKLPVLVSIAAIVADPPKSVTVVYLGHSVHVVVTQDVKSASVSHHDSLVGRMVIVTGCP